MNDKYLFDDSLLPAGFKYPPGFTELVGADDRTSLTPWSFLSAGRENSLFWLNTLREQFPNRSLVPFAKLRHSDDLACFDGADTSGNPKVLYVHAFTSPGWEQRGEVANFEEWLTQATEQAKEYLEERAKG